MLNPIGKRKDGVVPSRETMYQLLKQRSIDLQSGKAELTTEEFTRGFHYCADWDYLLIGIDDPEFESCTCYSHDNKQELRQLAAVKRLPGLGSDMTGEICECGGYFCETTVNDDRMGVLHCNKCDQEIKRYA